MAYLYQEIMNVPGLTGSWKERNAQLYEKLGSPMGAYQGNLQQNLYLLDQLKKNNYFQGGLPGSQPAPVAQPVAPPAPAPTTAADLSRQYTDPITGQMKRADEIPQFQNLVGDYMQIWDDRLAPGVMAAGKSQIDPEALREYNKAYEGYMGNLVSSGGQRFGRGFSADNAGGGLAGIGNLKAAHERQYNATLQDWMGQQKGAIGSQWYDKAADIWNKALLQIKPGETMAQYDFKVPSAEEALAKYGDPIGAGGSSSLLY